MESISTQAVERTSAHVHAAERHLVRPRRVLLLADAASAAFAVAVVHLFIWPGPSSEDQATVTIIMVALAIVATLALLFRAGQYTNRRRMSALADLGALVRDLVIATAAVTLLSYLTKGFFTGHTSPSRLAVGSSLLVFLELGLVSRFALTAYQRRQFARGHGTRRILVLGTGHAATHFLQYLEQRPWLGVEVTGRLCYGTPQGRCEQGCASKVATDQDSQSPDLPVFYLSNSLPGLKRLDTILRVSGAAEVVVALDPKDHEQFRPVADLLALAHVPFKVIPSLFEHSYRAAELLGYAEVPVIDFEVDPLDRVGRFFKRAMDVCVAGAALILLAPLELLIGAAIMAESGLPVMYAQERVGKNGRRFKMHKFRTMVKDAHGRLEDLRSLNEVDTDGRMFKMRSDPRVTRVGSFLRKLSLDELPQLVNVIRGEMSMVGPRPPLPDEVGRYEQEHLYRLKALPGITGLWQVSGRSALTFDDMVRLDRFYLDNWSLSLDLKILLRTPFAMLTRKGAC